MITTVDDRTARLALSCVVEAGDARIADLVAAVGPAEVWKQIQVGQLDVPLMMRAQQADVGQLRRRTAACNARFVIPGDDEWPAQLDDLAWCGTVDRRGGRPLGLWLRGPGHLRRLCCRSVAIVGARASTTYGDGVTADLAAELSDAGITIVSGGAFGIDAAAHRGALAAHGQTMAVLACGVDVGYPRGNAALFDWMAKEQLLVSEQPPTERPSRTRFLARNRIIAGLAQGTIVVEAAARSGARSTANWASLCQRQVMAVPGSVHSAMSVTPHQLIREQQAICVTSAAEVRELISPMGEGTLVPARGPERATDDLGVDELSVYEAIPARGALRSGELALKAGVKIGACMAALEGLEERGLVTERDGYWQLLR